MPSDTIDFVRLEPEEQKQGSIDFVRLPTEEPAEWQGPTQAPVELPARFWPGLVPPDARKAEPILPPALKALRESPPVEALLGRADGAPMKGEAASKIDRFGLIPGLMMPSDTVNTRKFRLGPQDTPAKQLGAGAYNAILGVADSFASPGSMLTLGAVGAMAQAPSIVKLISGAFGVDMAHGAIQQVPAAKRLYDEGDLQGAAEAATTALAQAGMSYAATKHALTPTPKAELITPVPTDQSPVDLKPPLTPIEPPSPGPSGRDITADQAAYERRLFEFQQGLGPQPGQVAGAPHFVPGQAALRAGAEGPVVPRVAPKPPVPPPRGFTIPKFRIAPPPPAPGAERGAPESVVGGPEQIDYHRLETEGRDVTQREREREDATSEWVGPSAPSSPPTLATVRPDLQASIVNKPAVGVAAGEIAVRPDLMQFKRADNALTGENPEKQARGQVGHHLWATLLWE